MNTFSLKLPLFEGPIDLLLTLVQRHEIDILEIDLLEIVHQIKCKFPEAENRLDLGAESIGHMSHLMLIKSRSLLPKKLLEDLAIEEEEGDFKVSLLEKLVEYCQVKEAALDLAKREEAAKESYFRASEIRGGAKRPFGIDHLTIDDLAALFSHILEKAKHFQGQIEEEEWLVSDKIKYIKNEIKRLSKIEFDILFSQNLCKEELIVFFLAVLELMKLQEIAVGRENETNKVVIIAYGQGN